VLVSVLKICSSLWAFRGGGVL